MILYILLLVFSGLMMLIALGLTIGGILKKKQKLWIGSLIAFVFFTLLTVFSTYTYVKASIDYMGTDEFQAEVRKKGENMGKSAGSTASGAAEGFATTLDDEAIAKLAHKSGIVIGKSVTALSGGLDETMGKTSVFADKSLENVGISIGRAEHILDSAKHSFGLFIEFKNDFDGKLYLTAYDSKGLKQDITEITVVQKAGRSKVYVFQFEYFEPGLSGYCILTHGK